MNVYAKFRNFPLRINKALGIFRIGATTRTTTTTTTTRTRRTTRVAIRDAFQRLKITLPVLLTAGCYRSVMVIRHYRNLRSIE